MPEMSQASSGQPCAPAAKPWPNLPASLASSLAPSLAAILAASRATRVITMPSASRRMAACLRRLAAQSFLCSLFVLGDILVGPHLRIIAVWFAEQGYRNIFFFKSTHSHKKTATEMVAVDPVRRNSRPEEPDPRGSSLSGACGAAVRGPSSWPAANGPWHNWGQPSDNQTANPISRGIALAKGCISSAGAASGI